MINGTYKQYFIGIVDPKSTWYPRSENTIDKFEAYDRIRLFELKNLWKTPDMTMAKIGYDNRVALKGIFGNNTIKLQNQIKGFSHHYTAQGSYIRKFDIDDTLS